MKNVVHTIASFSVVIWLTGYLAYDMGGWFHYFLLAAVVSGAARIFMEKKRFVKKTNKA